MPPNGLGVRESTPSLSATGSRVFIQHGMGVVGVRINTPGVQDVEVLREMRPRGFRDMQLSLQSPSGEHTPAMPGLHVSSPLAQSTSSIGALSVGRRPHTTSGSCAPSPKARRGPPKRLSASAEQLPAVSQNRSSPTLGRRIKGPSPSATRKVDVADNRASPTGGAPLITGVFGTRVVSPTASGIALEASGRQTPASQRLLASPGAVPKEWQQVVALG